MNRYALFILILIPLVSCSLNEDNEMDLNKLIPPVVEKKGNSPAPMTKDTMPAYHYPYTGERDPFVSLVGGSKGTKRSSKDSQRSIENFSQLQLKGILQDPLGPVALISSNDGENFKLKNGVIYDRRNKKMLHVSGTIKATKVTLYGPNKTMRVLTLK